MPETTLEPAIAAHDLTKIFHDPERGPITAAHAITLECRSGEVFGLLGPNGAGKTTTLRMLSTVLRPTSGTARVAGHDVVAEPLAVRAKIGFLSGNTGLYARLTPRETLRYFGRLHAMDGEALERRIDAIIDQLDLRAYADRRCEKLSTGNRQKTSIARAIVHDPPVLILDEPSLGLDVLAAGAMIQFIADCRSRGKCVLFSTHIMAEAEKLCDRVAIIHQSEVRAVDTLDGLRERTGQRFLEDVFLSLVRN